MNTKLTVVTVLFIAVIIGAIILILVPAPSTVNAPTNGNATTTVEKASIPDLITVSLPLPNTRISSPLAVTGEARGGWFFEASAPVQLLNASGTVIGEGPATALGEWMTSEYVPFSAKIIFPIQPAGSKGTLVLKNDNPSGMPENEKKLEIPVTF